MTEPIHLDVQLARELTFEDIGEPGIEGWTVVEKKTTGRGRWDIHKRIVIRNDEGQHYAATYSEGATEHQDYDSFTDRETYEFKPVVVRTRMVEVTEYVAGADTEPAQDEACVADACPHCHPTHRDPRTRSWGVWVGTDRDGDGQPLTLQVAPSNGAHVAESDAEWLRQLIRDHNAGHATPKPVLETAAIQRAASWGRLGRGA